MRPSRLAICILTFVNASPAPMAFILHRSNFEPCRPLSRASSLYQSSAATLRRLYKVPLHRLHDNVIMISIVYTWTTIQALADISRSRMLSQQRIPCTDCKSAQWCTTRDTPTIPPSYVRVHMVVWICGRGQTHRQTLRRAPIYILRRPPLTRNAIIM